MKGLKKKNKETNATEVMNIEEKPKKKKRTPYKELEPAKKKKVRRKYILISVAGAVVLLVMLSKILGGNAALPVMTKTVVKGDIEATLSTSGMVKSEERKSYYSQIDSKIGKIPVAVGDTVKKGEILLTYDSKEMDLAVKSAELDEISSKKGYEAIVADNNKHKNTLANANATITLYKEAIANQEAYVKQLEDSISDEIIKKRADLYEKQYRLEVSINAHNQELATSDPSEESYSNTQGYLRVLQNDLSKVNKDLALLQDYRTKDDREDVLVEAKKALTDMQTTYEEAKANKNASENAIMNAAKMEETKASSEKNTLQIQDKREKLEEAKDGITADFAGIVTEVTVEEGAPVSSAGTKLITLENSEKVKVEITVSKYDLERLTIGQKATVTIAGKEYEGNVSKINRMAVANASGTPVVTTEIHINNPDDSIYLGVEAKVKIDTAQAKDVILVPMEAVNTDKDGDFCYVAEGGVLVRKNVVIGISSDEMMEIKEGLSEGDQVVVGMMSAVEEGSKVVAIPQQ